MLPNETPAVAPTPARKNIFYVTENKADALLFVASLARVCALAQKADEADDDDKDAVFFLLGFVPPLCDAIEDMA